jgi:bifunctional UDP-N-acetylglucosamine pyrophosphorylase/glucosamine-1-phosphate N-acetyltransferase
MISCRVIEYADLAGDNCESVPGDDWTIVIPAAGRGTRLSFDRPKLLYPISGKPIVEWLVSALSPCCGRFVFVLSPSGAPIVTPELERLLPGSFDIAIQSEPRGMGDAVFAARDKVTTRNCLVVWGDQVGLRTKTIRACMRAHVLRSNALLTLPTVLRSNPYIHFERDPSGRLKSVLQAREGDTLPEIGESDCGVFLFETRALFEALESVHSSSSLVRGTATREFNLLPILPLFDRAPGNVCSVRVHGLEQTMGVNTVHDAEAIMEGLGATEPEFNDRS